MKIPNRIDTLLKRRTRLSLQLSNICCEIDEWLLKNSIEPDNATWLGGVEIFVNPEIAEVDVRNAIECK